MPVIALRFRSALKLKLRRRRAPLFWACFALVANTVAAASEQELGSVQQTLQVGSDGLVEAAGVDWVRGHCVACHSLDLVTAQRGDRQYWLDVIRWMQAKQNLWPIPGNQEIAILDYLSTHYAESDWGRRPNLPPALRPKID